MADMFELVGRMRVDGAAQVQRDLEGVSTAGEKTQSRLGGVLGKVGGVVKAVGAVAVAGVAAGAAGIAKITSDAIGAYAEYEQLVGGVQKIFGDNAAKVIENGAKAFKTAGMSANEYMSTVTSFSASLVQGLGGDTKAATEYADMAIRDMSDNANTYGTAIGDIQNAYNGFAKGNFTMLDNLKLGYGGTQAEMVRLMNDSGVLKEKIESMDGITFDQMIAAINATQTRLNITGTTAKEAAGTIEGSLNSTKAAWQNLLVGMGDDTQDFNALLNDFLTSAGNFVNNVTPRIKMIFDAIPEAIAKIAPQIPTLLQAILPGLIQGAIALVAGLVAQLPAILGVIKDTIYTAIDSLIAAIGQKAPQFAAPLKVAFNAVKAVIDTVTTHFDKIVVAVGAAAAAFGAFQLLSFIGQAGSLTAAIAPMVAAIKGATVAKIADKAATIQLQALYAKDAVLMAARTAKTIALSAAQKAAAAAQWLLNAAMNANPIGIIIVAITALIAAFVLLWNNNEEFRNFFIGMWENIKAVFGAVVEWLGQKLTELGQWFTETWQSIKSAVTTVINAISSVIKTIFEGIKTYFTTVLNVYKTIFTTVFNAIKTVVTTVVNAVKTVITTVFNAIKTYITTVLNVYKTIFTTVWNAIKTVITTVVNGIKTVVTSVFNAVKSFISNVFNGIKSITSSVWNGIRSTVSSVVNGIRSTVTSVFNSVKSTVSRIWNGIKTAIVNPINAAKNAVSNAISRIKSIVNGAHLRLPRFALPHFRINGGQLPWGIGGKGSPPSIGVDWYAKGGIFDQPTIIPTLKGLKGFGEAGAEAVTPINVLLDYVRTAVAEQNSGLAGQLQSIYAILAQYLPEMGYGEVVMDTGALVGQIAPSMDRKLARIYKNQERGRG